MANIKKTEVEEPTSTTKNGITKIDTTRTQKIIAKAKVNTKHTGVTKTKISKNTTKSTEKKSTTNKKSSTKSVAKKSTRKSKTVNDNINSKTVLVKEFNIPEYYDLPFSYNQTVVKILAQTPEILFVYWDISEEDRKKYVEKYGENFFYETKPVLIITNETMNYTFEVEINDFANSWYLHVNDSKCKYHIELGRRPMNNNVQLPNNYVSVASSNVIEAPNDHILFEKSQNMVYYKNVKTNNVTSKPITNLSFLSNMGRIYNIYDIYHKIYKNENLEDATNIMGNSSSVLK